jgi:hypothetical protein
VYEEPEDPEQRRDETPADPVKRASEKADEFRMHAELAAVFEGPRKFDAELRTGFDPQLARQVQRAIAKLEKAKQPDSPVLPQPVAADARELLKMPDSRGLQTNDYHVHRRPGEVMIVRWLAGDEVEAFYERFQAHFDVAIEDLREEEKSTHSWKQDPRTQAYLKALDELELKTADRYLREVIRQHRLFVLSTLAVDEMDVLHLANHLMGVSADALVGAASAPPEDDPTEQDRAWFFKLFSLRGIVENVERMCFFTYMQKAEDTFDLDA